MMLYTIAIVLVHAVLAAQGHNPFHRNIDGDDITALCEGKSVELVKLHDLRYINTIIKGSFCSLNSRAAIKDLIDLIDQTKSNLCAQESIDKLREFYVKYLDTSTEENKLREQLPRSLKDLALAYGMQMSNACKKQMVEVLTYEGQAILYSDRHLKIRALVSEKSPVATMLEGLAGPDEILLPSDLAPYIKDEKQAERANLEDDIIYVQSATAPYIRQMQDNCKENFAPLYKPLIRPIVQLVNMGFNYKDEPLRCRMGCSVNSRQLAKWSRLMFLCESLNTIRMVDVPKQADSEEKEGKTVRILTKEEAEALDIKSEGESEGEPEFRDYKYKAMAFNSDLIYNKGDSKLEKAIKAFSTSKSEEEKIAKRMLGKGRSLLWTQLKRHNFRVLLSTGYKSLKHRIRTGETLKPSDEIVKVLDGTIGHESDILDYGDLTSNWETASELAHVFGSIMAATLMGIIFIAIWAGLLALIVMKVIILVHMG